MNNQKLLSIENLTISFKREKEFIPVVHQLTYELYENEILGIVGESGSGKSVSSLAIMGLLPSSISKIANGSIVFEGKDISLLSDQEFQKIRGNEIAMIFQEPMSSLNPSMKCGMQVAEILEIHTSLSKKEIKNQVISLFEKVKLPMYSGRHIILICTEAFTNAAKHANCDTIVFGFFYENDSLIIKIKDNGIGFNTNDLKNGKGMTSIKKRAKIINFNIKVHSDPSGTTLTLTKKLPV